MQMMPGYPRVQQNWRRATSLTARISRLHHRPAAPAPTRVSLNPRPPRHRAPSRVPLNPRPSLAAPPNRPAAASLAPPLRPEVGTSTPVGRSRQRSMSMTSSPRALLEEYKMRWTCKVSSSQLLNQPILLPKDCDDLIRCALSLRWRSCSSLVVIFVFACHAHR